MKFGGKPLKEWSWGVNVMKGASEEDEAAVQDRRR